MWLIGSMPFEPGVDEVTIPMEVTKKDPSGKVIKKDWGLFTFEFNSCNTGRLITEPDSSDLGEPRTIPLCHA